MSIRCDHQLGRAYVNPCTVAWKISHFVKFQELVKRLRKRASASKCIRTRPSRSEHLQKFQKTGKHVESVANTSQKFDNHNAFFSNVVFELEFFAESIRMYPNVAERVKPDPNKPQHFEKLGEFVEQLRKTVKISVNRR